MYQHIGKKLKVFAEIWCLLAALGAVAAAVLMYLGGVQLWICIVTGIGGIAVAVDFVGRIDSDCHILRLDRQLAV